MKHVRRSPASVMLFAMLVVSSCSICTIAQTTGSILGRVADSSGAVITSATVTATNLQTRAERTTSTDATGNYLLSLLPVGTYDVSVTASGFARRHQAGVVVDVEQHVRVDFEVQPGSVNQEVVVNSDVPQVDTTVATLGKVMEERRITNLPLNGRNFMQLAVLQPGVVPPAPGITSQGSGANTTPGGVTVNFAVNGTRLTSNNYMLDGVNNVEPFTGTAMIVPSIDTIQEFRILTNLYNAEYGVGGGSIVTILTKSGTNSLHLSAYEFLRNDIFDARNYFAPTVPKLRQNQFGATTGGPIIKNRTFFFASYEGYRQVHGQPVSAPVPSIAERNGDFSQDKQKPIDPSTKLPFPNNQILAGRVSSIAKNILNFYPLPNNGPTTWSGTTPVINNRNQVDVKVDHALIPNRNTLNGRYIFDKGSLSQNGGYSILSASLGLVQVPNFGVQYSNTFHNLAIGDTHIFSARTLNEAHFSYQRSDDSNLIPQNHTDPKSLGFTYPIDTSVVAPPGVAISGYSPSGYNIFNTYNMNFYEWSDNVTLILGKHNIRFGGDLRRTTVFGVFPSIVFGGYAFTGAVSGNAVADLLLGKPLELVQAGGVDSKNVSQTAYGLFVQDQYRVTPKLSLTLGVRWDVTPGYSDPQNYEMTYVAGERSVQSPTLPLGLVRPGDPGVPSTIFDTNHHNVAPRVGFAWDPFGNGKTSVRGGYGLFYDGSSLLQIALVQMPPDIQPLNTTLLPSSFADPYNGNSPFTPPVSVPLKFAPGFAATWVDRNFKIPYFQQWSLSIQRQLTASMAMEMAYIGDKGTHLQGTFDLNQAIWSPGATTANLPSRRPIPGIGNVLDIAPAFSSNYNGLQMSLTKRAGNGLSFQAGYTFSRAIDFSSLLTGFYIVPGQQTRSQNFHDLNAERGLSGFDIRHRFVGSFVYELPFAKHRSGFLSYVLGDWRLNGIATASSGRPFTVFDSGDPNHGGLFDNTRPNLLRNPNLPADRQSPLHWFDTTAFQRITPGTWGNEPRNILFTGGILNFDMGLGKDFRISGEDKKLQFRWEVFNVMNHSDFSVPQNDLNNPATFGQVFSTSMPERQMQFALKFFF